MQPIERVQRYPVQVPQPAVGTDWSVTPHGLGRWRVLAVVGTLTTSAVVANRGVQIVVDDQTTIYFRTPAGAVQINGTAVKYSAFDGGNVTGLIGANISIGWPNKGIIVPEGGRIRSITDNLDAVGDQWSALALYVEELPSGGFFQAYPVESYDTQEP